MKLIAVALIALMALSASADQATNDFVDQILTNARPMLPDPVGLPGDKHTFCKTVIFKVCGGAEYGNGYVSGLRSLQRISDVNVQSDGNNLYLEIGLALGSISGQYSGRAWFTAIKVGVTAKISVSGAAVKVLVSQSLTGGSPRVQKLQPHVGNINISIDGMGLIGWALGGLLSFTTNIVKNNLLAKFNEHIVHALNGALSDAKIPSLG